MGTLLDIPSHIRNKGFSLKHLWPRCSSTYKHLSPHLAIEYKESKEVWECRMWKLLWKVQEGILESIIFCCAHVLLMKRTTPMHIPQVHTPWQISATLSWAWWFTSVISAHRKLRWVDKASQNYNVKPCLKANKKKTKNKPNMRKQGKGKEEKCEGKEEKEVNSRAKKGKKKSIQKSSLRTLGKHWCTGSLIRKPWFPTGDQPSSRSAYSSTSQLFPHTWIT